MKRKSKKILLSWLTTIVITSAVLPLSLSNTSCSISKNEPVEPVEGFGQVLYLDDNGSDASIELTENDVNHLTRFCSSETGSFLNMSFKIR